jgi:hypothetical protein
MAGMEVNLYEPPKTPQSWREAKHYRVGTPIMLMAVFGGCMFGAYAFAATLWIPPPADGKLMFPGLDGAVFMGIVYFCFGFVLSGLLAAPLVLAIHWLIKARRTGW